MDRINYISVDDFLSGKYQEDNAVGKWSIPENDTIPYRPGLFKRDELMNISAKVPQTAFAVASWQSVVGTKGTSVHIKSRGDKDSDSKRRLRQNINDLLDYIIHWGNIQEDIVEMLAREGNAILFINKNEELTVASRFDFHYYHDKTTGITRYAYAPKMGREVPGLQNLYHGQDLWHFKLAPFRKFIVAPSPLEVAALVIKLESHAITANQKFFDNGMIGTALLNFDKDMLTKLRTREGKETGFIKDLMEKVNDLYSGAAKAFRVGYVPGVTGAVDISKTNADMQFDRLLGKLTLTRIAWAHFMVPSNFGDGEQMTMNNVSVFNEALYDRIGHKIEQDLDRCRNEWLLPKYGVYTANKIKVKYVSPNETKTEAERKQLLEEYKNDVITRNEYLMETGREPVEGGDVYYSEIVRKVQVTNSTESVFSNSASEPAHKGCGDPNCKKCGFETAEFAGVKKKLL